jgi:pyruvate dehydrogenase E2 component (dihydrolipoamide acetyltransferase)
MPRLSDQMEEGTIVSWLIEDGQPVTVGDEIAEIETDKATASYAAEIDGVLRIVAPVGSTIAVGEVIARIGPANATNTEPGPAVAESEPAASPDAAPVSATAPVTSNGRSAATPIALRVAGQHGIDLAAVNGTGPRGRITKDDVLRAASIDPAPEPQLQFTPAAPAPKATPAAAPPPASAKGETTIQQPSRLQQLVARRMAEAKATVPHFQVQTDVRFDAVIALRAQLKATAADGDAVPSLNDFIVRACALALRDHPLVNGSYHDGAYELHSRINIGIAVAADDGLVVVTVPDADIKSLGQIARDSRRLAARVRDKTISPAELAGQTFTVSNLGMYGMTAITPVINPPQAAILGVGAARPVLRLEPDGQVTQAQELTLTLSCDHRILNGADGSRFLLDVKQRLTAPLRLAL